MGHEAVEDAFRTVNSKFVYNSRLQEALPEVFGAAELQSVNVPFEANTPSPVANGDEDDDGANGSGGSGSGESVPVGVVIGCVAGAFVLVSSGTYYYRYQRRQSLGDMKTLPDSPLSARDVLRVARPQDAMDEDSVKDIMVARIVEVRKNNEDEDESLISALEDPTVFQSMRQNSSREEGDTWTISNNTIDNTLGGNDSILQSPDSKDDIYNRIYGQPSETIAPTITSNNATLNSSSQHILKNIIDPGSDNEEPLYFDDEDEREVFEICAPSGKLGIVVDSPSSDMPPVTCDKGKQLPSECAASW